MFTVNDTDNWASNEFCAAQLGDARLTQRLINLAHRLSQSSHCSLPKSLNKAELKAAYRFFDNPKVDADGVLKAHIEQTLGRMREVPVVLAVQDTTEFNLSHLPATKGLGRGTGSNLHGFMMHSTLAVTPEGLPLGVLGMKTWTRSPDELGKSESRRQRSVKEKESVKWLESLEHLSELKAHCPDTHIVGVCDREGDIFDMFVAERAAGVDWLIRASWNRRVDHPEKYLWEAISAESILGKVDLTIPKSSYTDERTARIALRCAPAKLRPPKHRSHEKLPDVEVFVIHALEINALKGCEPLEWMLLTSVPTHTCEQVLEVLSWYARRWGIESWHRTLKSGCNVEARQFGNIDRFVRATALFAVIAWRILFATMLARLDGDLSCEVLLQPLEWRALYCRTHNTTRPPGTPPSLADAVLWIAKLGGYLARKNDRPPGATVMWRGFLALHESTEMYRIFNQK
jgi:hypothetical protein